MSAHCHTPPKGPDYEEVKAVLGEWINLGSYGDPEILDSLAVWKSVQAARATDDLLQASCSSDRLSHNCKLRLQSFDQI